MEIFNLKAQLANGGIVNVPSPMDLEMIKNIEQEKSKLAEYYEGETERLKDEHESQRKEKEDLMKGKLQSIDFFHGHFLKLSVLFRYDEAQGTL